MSASSCHGRLRSPGSAGSCLHPGVIDKLGRLRSGARPSAALSRRLVSDGGINPPTPGAPQLGGHPSGWNRPSSARRTRQGDCPISREEMGMKRLFLIAAVPPGAGGRLSFVLCQRHGVAGVFWTRWVRSRKSRSWPRGCPHREEEVGRGRNTIRSSRTHFRTTRSAEKPLSSRGQLLAVGRHEGFTEAQLRTGLLEPFPQRSNRRVRPHDAGKMQRQANKGR